MSHFKIARERKNLSQKEIAIQLKVTPATVSDWESGKKKPNAENLKSLSAMLGVSADYLLNLSDIPVSVDSFFSSFIDQFDLRDGDFYPFFSELSLEDFVLLFTPAISVPEKFQLRLKRARFSSKLTQHEAAKAINVPLDEYKAYESGEKRPDWTTVESLSRFFNVDPAWLNCSLKYIDPESLEEFNPGEYKAIVDSAYDPLDLSDELFGFRANIAPSFAHMINIIKNQKTIDMMLALDHDNRIRIEERMTILLDNQGKIHNSVTGEKLA